MGKLTKEKVIFDLFLVALSAGLTYTIFKFRDNKAINAARENKDAINENKSKI